MFGVYDIILILFFRDINKSPLTLLAKPCALKEHFKISQHIRAMRMQMACADIMQ